MYLELCGRDQIDPNPFQYVMVRFMDEFHGAFLQALRLIFDCYRVY